MASVQGNWHVIDKKRWNANIRNHALSWYEKYSTLLWVAATILALGSIGGGITCLKLDASAGATYGLLSTGSVIALCEIILFIKNKRSQTTISYTAASWHSTADQRTLETLVRDYDFVCLHNIRHTRPQAVATHSFGHALQERYEAPQNLNATVVWNTERFTPIAYAYTPNKESFFVLLEDNISRKTIGVGTASLCYPSLPPLSTTERALSDAFNDAVPCADLFFYAAHIYTADKPTLNNFYNIPLNSTTTTNPLAATSNATCATLSATR